MKHIAFTNYSSMRKKSFQSYFECHSDFIQTNCFCYLKLLCELKLLSTSFEVAKFLFLGFSLIPPHASVLAGFE